MSNIRAVKGMNDLFEDQLASWRMIEQAARETFLSFGYGEVRTPVLEETQLFVRSVGETTDIVEKEMYAFADRDKKQTSLCLRPENTAGVVRALVQHGKLPADAEARVFYIGPMFRRERPQKGRYRQFHQLGVEAFGLDSPTVDVEMMAMLHTFLERLGLSGIRLVLNSLGDQDDRVRYREALTDYFGARRDELCADCQRRLETNPLRVLDCKVETCKAIAKDAPQTLDSLGEASRAHFDAVCEGLTALDVAFDVDTRLVRGLDYYTRTVFEALADTGLGAQNAVGAGGRYDNLVSELGGRPTPGVGFAAGIERLALLLEDAGKAVPAKGPDLMLIGADDAGRAETHKLALALRKEGLRIEVDHRGRSVKAQMKSANRTGAACSLVLGSRELEEGKAGLKFLSTGDVKEVELSPDRLKTALLGGAEG